MPTPARSLHPLSAVPPTRQYLRAMWARRDFAVALPVEQLRTSHQTTLLGNVWHLGNPLLSVVVYYVVFGVLLNTSRGTDNFVLFLMVGVFSFGLTSRTVLAGAKSISDNSGLMRAIRFPRALLPISVLISNVLTFAFELSILAGVALVTGEGVSQRWLALPLVLLVHSALNLGGAFVAARLNDSFRDVQQIIPFLFRLGMYASGVMFDIQRYAADGPSWVRTFIHWNPLVQVVQVYRWLFLGTPLDVGAVVRYVAIAGLLLVVGFRFFRSAELRYGRA
jgi:teichoic acid transport system permease protein